MGSRGHSICAVVLPEKTQKQRRNWKPSSQGSNQHFSNRRCRYPKQELNLMHHKIFQMISHLSDENEGQRDEPLFQSHRLFTAESTNGSSIPGSKSPSLILQSLVNSLCNYWALPMFFKTTANITEESSDHLYDQYRKNNAILHGGKWKEYQWHARDHKAKLQITKILIF